MGILVFQSSGPDDITIRVIIQSLSCFSPPNCPEVECRYTEVRAEFSAAVELPQSHLFFCIFVTTHRN